MFAKQVVNILVWVLFAIGFVSLLVGGYVCHWVCLSVGLSVIWELCLSVGLSVIWELCLSVGLCVCGLVVCEKAF